MRVDKDGIFTPENVFLPEEYTPLWELTKLKILYTRRMYTSMRVFFHWKIFTSVRVHKNGVF